MKSRSGFFPRGASLALLTVFAVSCARVLTAPAPAKSQSSRADDLQNRALHVGGRGAQIDESKVVATFFVDQARGDDGNLGTKEKPVASINRGFALCGATLGLGQATKLVVGPGLYREALGFGPPNVYKALFVLEGTDAPHCVVTASDRFSGWSGPDAAGVYSHSWAFKWGSFLGPQSDNPPAIAPEMTRYENIVFNGKMLLPRVSKAALAPGTFFTDEASGTLFLKPPAGADPNDTKHDVEVATRIGAIYDDKGNHRDCSILHFFRPNATDRATPANVVMRGLTFENNPGGLFNPVLYLQGVSNCLVENVRVRNGGYDGLNVSGDHNTVRRCILSDNGEKGFGGDGDDNLYEDVTVERNCVKGAAFGWNGWDGGAFKCGGFTNSTVRRMISRDNATKGMWFDTACVGDLVEDCVVTGNTAQYCDGIFWENNNRNTVPNLGARVTGLLRRCRFENNASGFFTAESENVLLDRCIMRDNKAQIAMYNGTNPPRGVLNNIAFQGCTVEAVKPGQELFGIDIGAPAPSWTIQFLPSLRADKVFGTDGNHYSSPQPTPFLDANGQKTLTFAAWQAALKGRGADQNSTFGR